VTAGKVIEEWNPRFVAFAASLGRSPEAQRAYSLRDVRRQGPFIVWIQQQWFAFFRELGLPGALGVGAAAGRRIRPLVGRAVSAGGGAAVTAEVVGVVGERPPLGARLWLALRFAAGPVSAHCTCGCQESRSLGWRLRLRAAWVLLRWRV